MSTKWRGANSQRHQKPYATVGKLTDKPAGTDPYRGDCDMSQLDVDTMAKAEGSTAGIRPQSSNSAMAKRDNSGDGESY
jgi:hypothetical protein